MVKIRCDKFQQDTSRKQHWNTEQTSEIIQKRLDDHRICEAIRDERSKTRSTENMAKNSGIKLSTHLSLHRTF